MEDEAILKKRFHEYVYKEVLSIIEPEELLAIKAPNVWEHKGKPLTSDVMAQLKEEARIFRKSKLWGIVKAEVRYHAMKRLLEKGETTQDILVAKTLCYLIDIIDTKINNLSK